MVERQPSWDKYEAVILLEGLLTSMKGELTRSDAIKAVSRDLRVMALHRGMSSTLGLCSIAHLHNGSRLPSLPHSNLTVPARVSLKFFYAQKSAPVFSVNAHE